MKYPQLVSIPSSVQDWLDEQLEARGIDAVVYTRYIFSLLQRDTLDLPDDLLTLSCSKGKEFGRRGRKRGRREEYWDVWDCEQLKRFAAVECLMSASDQKFGIEKLVDELCAKLKEIQSEGESSVQNTSSDITAKNIVSIESQASPRDQAQKYYAAFPPLRRPNDSSCNRVVLSVDESSVWGNKKILSSSFGRNKPQKDILNLLKGTEYRKSVDKENQRTEVQWKESVNMRSRNHLHNPGICKEKSSYGFAWNMEGGIDRENGTTHCEFIDQDEADGWRVLKYNRQNRMGSDNLQKSYNSLNNDADSLGIGDCRRLYERQSEDSPQMNSIFESQLGTNSNEIQNSCVDENLAQLIAKFDQSIEALWSPDTSTDISDNADMIADKKNCPLEEQFVANDPNSFSIWGNSEKSSHTSFIRCGTNITDSIWSSQLPTDAKESDRCAIQKPLEEKKNVNHCVSNLNPDQNKCPLEDDDFGSFFGVAGKAVGSNTILMDLRNRGDTICHFQDLEYINSSITIAEKRAMGKNFDSIGVMSSGRQKDNVSCQFHSSEHFGTTVGLTEGKPTFSWNKCQNFLPSLFSALPMNEQDFIIDDFSSSDYSSKWSSIGCYNAVLGNSNYNMFPNCMKPHSLSVFSDNFNTSFSTLNHNKEDSSFIEVIPKQACSDFGPKSGVQIGNTQKSTESVYFTGNESEKSNEIKDEVKEKEEDLLTSTRTHFRPIRQENSDCQTGYYADGTTFVIPNSFESVPFKRSESGALYLEADIGIETPKKYMEFKEKERYCGHSNSPDYANTSADREFVPKFRVNQIEKYCQTEDTDDITSDEEVDPKRSRQEMKDCSTEFYFPGDDHFASKLNCVESDGCADPIVEAMSPSQHFSYNTGQGYETLDKSDQQYHNPRFAGDEPVELDDISQRWSAAVKSCCKCNHSNNFAAWKTDWVRSSSNKLEPKAGIWETTGSALQLHSWYDIWSGTESEMDPCLTCGSAALDSNKNPSPQQRKLREELSQDGEQLLSDLSYLQHLYLGSSSSELGPGCEEKLQCPSPTSESSNDVQVYNSFDLCGDPLSELHKPCENTYGNETEFEDFVSTCSPRTLPIKILLSMELEAEKKINERPFNIKATPKDRKRRHSGSQRPASNGHQLTEASTSVPHAVCEASAAVACRLWAVADLSRLKGTRVPRSLRPVTL